MKFFFEMSQKMGIQLELGIKEKIRLSGTRNLREKWLERNLDMDKDLLYFFLSYLNIFQSEACPR